MATGFNGKRPEQFITDAIITADYTSPIIEVLSLDRVGLEFSWDTSDIVGVMFIQVTISGNFFSNLTNPDGSIVRFPINGTTSFKHLDLDLQGFNKLRAFFDYTSGTTLTLQGHLQAKGLFNAG